MRLLSFALCTTLGFIPIVSSEFTEPSSDNLDFVQKWFVGDTIHIAWQNGWSWGVGQKPKTADLFIQWFDDSIDNPFWEMLQANISLDVPGKLDWKVDVQESVTDKSTQYRFRLMEHTNPAVYTLKNPRLPSRGFYIFPTPAASTSSSAISTTAAPSVSTSPSPSEVMKPMPEKSSKNIGAIAGGVAAGLVGLALLCGIALLLLRRTRQKRKAKANEEGPFMYEGKAEEYPPVELHGSPPSELDGSKQPHGITTELQGSTPRDLH